jgi:uncharacterized protein YbjT (DUF2867 family)
MMALATGAAGPFDSAVCRRLLTAGDDVTAIARNRSHTLVDGVDFKAGDVSVGASAAR